MPKNSHRPAHLCALPSDPEPVRRRCSGPGCAATDVLPSGRCGPCELAHTVDLRVLAPVVGEMDAILEPIDGLSAPLRDRVALVAAIWLNGNTRPGADIGDVARALGYGLLDAAIMSLKTPRALR